MKQRNGYFGKINGFDAYATDTIPTGMDVTRTITFYTPDDGKIFSKDGKLFNCVVQEDGIDIEDYEEIDKPAVEETNSSDEEEA